MSQTIPISATSKKRLDEKNGKIVKDLSLLLENRNCVECGMRGPTYVDVTTTSFCCATCAGVLRGINPPHRIKSISMATFTCDEVETIKNGGNELNRRTWMGLHSGSQVTNFASKEDRTNFITDKYERKKWYVSPEEVAKQKELLDRAVEAKSEQLRMNSTRNESMDLFSSISLGGTQPARPPPSVSLDSVFAPPSMLGGVTLDRTDAVDEPHPFSPPAFFAPPPPQPGTAHPTSLPISQQPTHMPINFAFGSPPTGLARQSAPLSPPSAPISAPIDPFSPLSAMAKKFPRESSRPAAVPPSSSFVPTSSMDPFGDPFGPATTSAGGGGGDPFGASSFSGFAVKFDDDTPTTSGPPTVKGGQSGTANPFDPFGMIAAPNQGASSSPIPSVLPPSSSSSSSLDPFSSLVSLPSLSAAAAPVAAVAPHVAAAATIARTMSPHPSPSPSIPPVVSNNDADKYSALAELDELFHSTTISGDTSNGKPSWVSTGFSAPPPSSGPAFPPASAPSGMGRSSTMGAISTATTFGGGAAPSSSTSFWAVNGGGHAPFQPSQGFAQSNASTGLGMQPQSGVYSQINTTAPPQQSQYAQAAAMTGNPFAAFPQVPLSHQPTPSNGGHPSNPNWNPFL